MTTTTTTTTINSGSSSYAVSHSRDRHLKPAELTADLVAAIRRFSSAEKYSYLNTSHHRDISQLRLRDYPVARAMYALGLQLEESANQAVRTYETWVENGLRFDRLCYGADHTISDKTAKEMYENWRVRAYVGYNCDYLRSIVEEERRKCKDMRAFDDLMYRQHAVNILLDSTPEQWNRTGSEGIVLRLAQVIRDNLHVEVRLMTEDEALDHLIVTLDTLSQEYEFLMRRAAQHIAHASQLMNGFSADRSEIA